MSVRVCVCVCVCVREREKLISLVVQEGRGHGFDPWSGKIPHATKVVRHNY